MRSLRPTRAPAWWVVNSSSRLDHVPAARGTVRVRSAETSSWVIFAGATNMPRPCSRTRSPAATSSSIAERTVGRDTPSSVHRARSDGMASPGLRDSISSRTASRARSRLSTVPGTSTSMVSPSDARITYQPYQTYQFTRPVRQLMPLVRSSVAASGRAKAPSKCGKITNTLCPAWG